MHYSTYDVTGHIKPGDNALGVILGDGWFAGNVAWFGRRQYGSAPRLLAQLEIQLSDGTVRRIVSDAGWKAGTGPVFYQDIYTGCGRDSRKEIPGWDTASFDDSGWQPVTTGFGTGLAMDVTTQLHAAIHDGELKVTVSNDTFGRDPAVGHVKSLVVDYQLNGQPRRVVKAEGHTLVLGSSGEKLVITKALYGAASLTIAEPLIQALPNEPARIINEVPARTLIEPKPGQWTFDLGQNIVGWVRLKVRGKPGQKIVVRHGEMQNPDRTLYASNVRSAMSTEVYYR